VKEIYSHLMSAY